MAEPIYRKKGRRYVEVGTFDDAQMYYPIGSHLVVARPGGTLTVYNVEPANAPLLAAAVPMRDAMVDAMRTASYYKPDAAYVRTPTQQKAWDAYEAVMGPESSLRLQGASLTDIAQAGIDVLVKAVEVKL